MSRIEDTSYPEGGTGLLASVWRHKLWVVVLVLVGAAGGYLSAAAQAPLYASSTTLLLSDPRTQTVLTQQQNTPDPSRYIRNQAQVMTSTPVLDRAGAALDEAGFPGPVVVAAEPAFDVDSVVLTAYDSDAERAARVADAVAEAYERFRVDQVRAISEAALEELETARSEIQDELVAIRSALRDDPENAVALASQTAATDQLQLLEARSQELVVDTALWGGGVQLRDPAAVPLRPIEPQPPRTAAAAALIAFVLGCLLAWAWEARQQRRRGATTASSLMSAPVLAEVPLSGPDAWLLPVVTAPRSESAEAFRFLAAAVEHRVEMDSHRTLLVIGPGADLITAVAATSLAAGLSGRGHRVLLAEGGHNGQGRLLDAVGAGGAGLTRAEVRAENTWQGAGLSATTWPELDGLVVARASGAKPDDGDGQKSRVDDPRRAALHHSSRFDFVVLSAPGLPPGPDTFPLMSEVDAIVVVVDDTTTDEQLRETRRRLDLAATPVVGLVTDATTARRPDTAPPRRSVTASWVGRVAAVGGRR